MRANSSYITHLGQEALKAAQVILQPLPLYGLFPGRMAVDLALFDVSSQFVRGLHVVSILEVTDVHLNGPNLSFQKGLQTALNQLFWGDLEFPGDSPS
jgi:hypothetical protein